MRGMLSARRVFFLLVLGLLPMLGTEESSLAAGSENRTGLTLRFIGIRFDGWSVPGVATGSCIAQVDLAVSNATDLAYSILPHEGSFSYLIVLHDGEVLQEAMGCSTLSEHRRTIGEMDVQKFYIPSHEEIVVREVHEVSSLSMQTCRLMGGQEGVLQIEWRPRADLETKVYRHTQLFTNELTSGKVDVRVCRANGRGEWLIVPTNAIPITRMPDVVVNWLGDGDHACGVGLRQHSSR